MADKCPICGFINACLKCDGYTCGACGANLTGYFDNEGRAINEFLTEYFGFPNLREDQRKDKKCLNK